MELIYFQLLAAILFCIGIYGVLARKSAVLILMSIELMLNAVNINLIGYAAFSSLGAAHKNLGQVLVIFIITIAAEELALDMAIILRLYRNKNNVNVDELDILKG